MELNNIQESKNVIECVEEGSISEELGVEQGDILVAINDEQVMDVIDYKYLMSDDYVVVTIQKKDGEVWDLEIEKEYNEDIGIVFTNPLIDKAKSCNNKCIFCFIDQLPKGMRETLYFKDDDSRLSFLQGNFVSLTNMSDNEIDRIIKYKLSPINISVHTTDPDLRVKMMNNKRAGKVYEILRKFDEVGIEMDCQVVLVPGINDGDNLDRTLENLIKFHPNVRSVAIVPIGVTKFREGLHKVETYDHEKSLKLLEFIHDKQRKYLLEKETRFVYAADEFYVLASEKIPSTEEYEGFPQIENGVGLMRKFLNEITTSLQELPDGIKINKKYAVVTGELAKDFMREASNYIMAKFEGLSLEVIPIKNHFLGETITVSGLVTGNDIITQLPKQVNDMSNLDGIIIPRSMLKSGEDIYLDDITVDQLKDRLGKNIFISEVEGKSFINLFAKDEVLKWQDQ